MLVLVAWMVVWLRVWLRVRLNFKYTQAKASDERPVTTPGALKRAGAPSAPQLPASKPARRRGRGQGHSHRLREQLHTVRTSMSLMLRETGAFSG
jgi:hypothetical protein